MAVRIRALLVLLVVFGGIAAALSLYVSGRVDARALQPPAAPEFRVRVTAVGNGRISLRSISADTQWRQPGLFGLSWLGGFGQVREIIAIDESRGEVTRAFTPLRGAPHVGAFARVETIAFPGDPSSRGLAFEELTYPAPGGPTPAWLIRGGRERWLIYVHGKGGDRRNVLNTAPTFAGLGLATLVIQYRNDADAPGGQAGRYGYGRDEWRDVEAAVGYAEQAGARAIVLMGDSMGGGIVAAFLERSDRTGSVRAVILDAPMLDFRSTVDHGLAVGGVPRPLIAPQRWFAGVRYRIDWDALDYLDGANRLRAPILLFHGDEDRLVPVATSDMLARTRPDIVRYVRVPGAGHVQSWNTDPERYEAALREFLMAALR